jgi:hypothetical protein
MSFSAQRSLRSLSRRPAAFRLDDQATVQLRLQIRQASMKPNLSRARDKYSFLECSSRFGPASDNSSPMRLALVLDWPRCELRAPWRIKPQSQLLPSSAEYQSAQVRNRNKWQGPTSSGKDAVYAGSELEPIGTPRSDPLGLGAEAQRVWLIGRSCSLFLVTRNPQPVRVTPTVPTLLSPMSGQK